MKFPFITDVRKRIDAKLAPIGAESVLGVDLGTSSVKIVQLRKGGELPVLETYGEIELGAYGNANAREAVRIPPERIASAIQDLFHEVEASARSGGIAIPLSSSLISVVDLPKRDTEQMNRIIRSDAKRFIPMPIEKVTIDWFAIPEEESSASAFDKAEEKVPVQMKMQKVFLAATNNEALASLRETASLANLRAAFFEIESFGAIRSCADTSDGAVLIVDLGASTTKICISSRDRSLRAAHIVDISGQKITEILMGEMHLNFREAEDMKRSVGLSRLSDPADERSRASSLIKAAIEKIFGEAKRIMERYDSDYKNKVTDAIFIGGGADMRGLLEYGARELGIPAKLGAPFSRVSTPMILEDVLREASPRYAIAMGLALRAIKYSAAS